MPRLPTIGDAIRDGHDVHAACGGCGRSRKLDLTALAVAHGENAAIYTLAKRFRCSACGWRGFGLARIPVNASGFARTHVNRWEKPKG